MTYRAYLSGTIDQYCKIIRHIEYLLKDGWIPDIEKVRMEEQLAFNKLMRQREKLLMKIIDISVTTHGENESRYDDRIPDGIPDPHLNDWWF